MILTFRTSTLLYCADNVTHTHACTCYVLARKCSVPRSIADRMACSDKKYAIQGAPTSSCPAISPRAPCQSSTSFFCSHFTLRVVDRLVVNLVYCMGCDLQQSCEGCLMHRRRVDAIFLLKRTIRAPCAARMWRCHTSQEPRDTTAVSTLQNITSSFYGMSSLRLPTRIS